MKSIWWFDSTRHRPWVHDIHERSNWMDVFHACRRPALLLSRWGGMPWSWGTHPVIVWKATDIHSIAEFRLRDLTIVSNHSYPGASSPINLDLRMLNSISQLIISLLLLHIYCILLPSIHLSMGRPGRISHHGNTYREPPSRPVRPPLQMRARTPLVDW